MSGSASSAMTLGELFSGFALLSADHAGRQVAGLTLDSRKSGCDFVYFALSGKSTHGLRYVDDVIAAGALAIAVDADDPQLTDALTKHISSRALLIRVTDLSAVVGELAARYYGNSRDGLTVIGVTGTDGKTSVSHCIAQALNASGRPTGLVGTLGWGLPGNLHKSDMTTPDPVELHRQLAEIRRAGAAYACMEVSSHALDQGRVNGIGFEVAVFTNLARDHLDYHGTVEHYGRAKQRLFEKEGLSAVVINADDAFGRHLLKSTLAPVRPVAYAIDQDADVFAESVTETVSGLVLLIRHAGKRMSVESRLVGRFNAYNILAAFGVLSALGLADEEIAEALASLQPVEGRMEKFAAAGKPTVIVDFAHTPQALALVLGELKKYCKGELWCVFGCGGDRDKGKRAEMGRAAEALADQVVVTNDNPRTEDPQAIADEILEGFTDAACATVILDRAAAIEYAIDQAGAEDWVAVAGKGHEDYQIFGAQRLPFSDRAVVQASLGVAAP
ncbi:MAG: UDP-N-acetylmuramoyl-L-alanyl-D-glutamate--2,6-diaminopimelate ligase [Gammaproteobacteria bacterium]|nr:UDP-N-acetylmuramoyl-L-alanyl-D-glutamate--2,6-diaminopimelate ligase [Gammaproteobacteria bacterium]